MEEKMSERSMTLHNILEEISKKLLGDFSQYLAPLVDKNDVPRNNYFLLWTKIEEWKDQKNSKKLKKQKMLDTIYGRFIKKTGASAIVLSADTLEPFLQAKQSTQADYNESLFDRIQEEVEGVLVHSVAEFRGDVLLQKEHSSFLENHNGDIVFKKAPFESVVAWLLVDGEWTEKIKF